MKKPNQNKVLLVLLFFVAMAVGTSLADSQVQSADYANYTPTPVPAATGQTCTEMYDEWYANWSTDHPDRPINAVDEEQYRSNLALLYGC